jgi:outer membrane protein OmpA-like peptidoglycan-associated protein
MLMNRSNPFRTLLPAALFAVAFPALAFAQLPNPTSVPAPQGAVVAQNGDVFFYKVNVVQRDIDAVNYFHRSGTTHVAFIGTNLLPNASGKADVKSERGVITVNADFKGLTPANGFGPEYLTYVLWAISPDGNPLRLAEILPDGTKNNVSVTVPSQAFGMIVTAEPYFAVSTPSDVIVLKNVFTDRTNGVLETVDAKATLLPRGVYADATDGAHTVSNPITRNEQSPLELYEAYNAQRIAKDAGAEKYAPEIYTRAQQDLTNAADIDSSKHRDKKLEITYARGAVERFADARVATLRKKAAERQQNAELAKVQAQANAAASQAEAQQSALQAEKAREAAQQAQLQAQQSQLAKAQADAAAAQAQAQALSANQRADAANERAANAEQMREKLRAQLNEVLQTTETARGLIVNLSDVLFDTGKYTLKPNTQVSLARIAGIFQSYPGLKIQVEGYTDSTGSVDRNQALSQNRANTTMNFLISQGVAPANISGQGYGESDPVADNATAAGRAQNRRVELVVSGAAIGVPNSAPPAQ